MPRVARRAVVEGTAALARQAPEFAPYVDEHGPADLKRERPQRTHFAELARAICFQQLAGAAARTIHGRFEASLDGDVTPEGVLALPVETMRAAGLSAAKTASIRDLAEKVLAGDVELDRMAKLSDDKIVEELTLVRGIGRWTAEMFLMFNLLRPDIFPVGDLGLQKAVHVHYYNNEKIPLDKLREHGEAWRPWRSVATWYLWRSLDPVPVEY